MVGSIEDAKPISASPVPIASSLVGQNESKESTIGGRRKRGRPKKQAAPPVVSQKATKRDENLCNDVNMSDGGNVETLVPHHVDESSIAGRRKALGRSRKRAADAIKDQVELCSAIPLASLNPVSENCGTSDITGVKDNFVKEGNSDGHCRNSVSRPRKQDIVKCDQNDHLSGAATKDGEPDDAEAKSDHMKVKDTLRLFNKHYLHFVQEEERRYKEVEATLSKASNAVKVKPKGENKKVVNASPKASKSSKAQKSKAEDGNEEIVKRASKRPDLKAISKMIEDQTVLNHQKRIGSIPGVDVGQQFFSRAEMVVLGLHGHWLNGIDYMGQGYSKLEMYKHLTFPVAVCIVLSGMYEDDTDNADEVVYTGQGGHDLLGSKHQISDQKMARGNLALKNNADTGVPVRVVRGHESTNSYCGKVYTYDGLYQVIKWWGEKGVSGFTVFKYKLRRLDGQPNLTTKQVHFARAQAPRSISELRGLVSEDISDGQENLPIPATNEVDDPPFAPKGFVYSKAMRTAKDLKIPSDAVGCDCVGDCVDLRKCACAGLNGFDFPYVRKDGGRLVEAKDVVFECGPNCSCNCSCVNRISQRGLKYRLEVYRTPKKGWAVRSWDTIPSGAPVCEYIGVLERSDEVDSVSENSYIFDIDCLQTMKGLDGRERRRGALASLSNIDDKQSDVPEYCINAGSVGNVARFINHSCEPNLFVQCVLSSHHDFKMARVVLFAADTIPPLQELTYDYGYALDSVVGPDGKVKTLNCYCGATGCKKRLY
ncbi:histone-lysine N-methyltransferase, H3 lysine-9 specific SUVH4 [Dioscorea cayenensis subsp. rotundata]|uniref:Histone-lysine N-methyltransferase, H3 lysine-9 specific SUVH4 n=1 Tax=Dioscorea cayennensis subsp. rotundata TaxID=55577 RepID=A0AB40AIR7_DIOCR|nr:histone-lysine N-methyltransferase, H3 lysine-9 specific SUVH4 [Dioscorea cayenensis subsp. rotundata]XP_039114746.1 histone-lysine N-methyltransferase, H3 lysine-9 specific SUVH4 [Dioscorea cayenensis subsp. rotundata]